jgi:hypothetical protein
VSVYFAQRRKGGLIKIGWSRNVKYRMANLQAKVIGAVPGTRKTEVAMHKRFADLRVRGEWFKADEKLLAYIRDEAQNHEPDLEATQTAIRLPKSFLKRLDNIAVCMSQPGLNPVTRTEVLRRAALLGLERLEAEQKKR